MYLKNVTGCKGLLCTFTCTNTESSVSWPEGLWNEGIWNHVMDETDCGCLRQNVGKVVWVLRLLFSRGKKIFVTLRKTLGCLLRSQCRFEPFVLAIIGDPVPPSLNSDLSHSK